MLTSKRAAQILDVTQRYLGILAKTGKLPFTPTPYGRLYDPADVATLAAERAANATRYARQGRPRKLATA